MKAAPILLCAWLAAATADADILKGVVRDSTGAPVQAADFDVFTPDGTLMPQDDNTDADGTYTITLPAGHYEVVCSPLASSRFASRVLHDVAVFGVTRVNWVMAPSTRVIGRVLGSGGAPVAAADLDFDRVDDGSRQPVVGDVTSIFGTFAAYLEAGEYRVSVYPPAGADLAPALRSILTLPTTDTLRFVLAPALHLSGVVRDADGGGVAGARLSFRRAANDERVPAWGRVTDAGGAFHAGAAADTYHVLVQPPRGAHLAAVRIDAVDLTADRTLEVTLPAAMIVSGRVLDSSYRPVARATWDAVDEITQNVVPTPDDLTDYAGVFELALPVGLYRLTLKPPLGSGLDTLVLRDVRVARDTVVDVVYRDPNAPVQSSLRLVALETPTHRRATLRLVLPRAGRTRVEIFDVAGCRVRQLVDEVLPAGVHDLHWNGDRQNGAGAHTGLYFVRAVQENERVTTRFILLP